MQTKATLLAAFALITLAPQAARAAQAADAVGNTPQAAAPGGTTPAATSPANTPPVIVGAAVKDTKGAPVGTIAAVDGGYATLTTATNTSVRLPLTSFGQQDGGLIIAMSAAEVDAAAKASSPGK